MIFRHLLNPLLLALWYFLINWWFKAIRIVTKYTKHLGAETCQGTFTSTESLCIASLCFGFGSFPPPHSPFIFTEQHAYWGQDLIVTVTVHTCNLTKGISSSRSAWALWWEPVSKERKTNINQSGIVAHICNLSIWKPKIGDLRWLWGQSGLQNEILPQTNKIKQNKSRQNKIQKSDLTRCLKRLWLFQCPKYRETSCQGRPMICL